MKLEKSILLLAIVNRHAPPQSVTLFTIKQVEWGAGCLALRTRNDRLDYSFNPGGLPTQLAPQYCGHATRGIHLRPTTPIPIQYIYT